MAKRKIESVTPFITFQGRAQEALDLYVEAFPAAKVTDKIVVGEDEEGIEGTITQAILHLGDSTIRVMDVPTRPGFHFSSAMSLFVEVNYAGTIDTVSEVLAKGGEVFMPPDEYDFAERFTWLSDKFGVNWQLIHGQKL